MSSNRFFFDLFMYPLCFALAGCLISNAEKEGSKTLAHLWNCQQLVAFRLTATKVVREMQLQEPCGSEVAVV